MPSHSDVVSGAENIQAFWQGVFDMGVKEGVLETIDLEELGDTAIETGRYTMKADDGAVADRGKYLVVWKLHKDIFNTNQPVAKRGRPVSSSQEVRCEDYCPSSHSMTRSARNAGSTIKRILDEIKPEAVYFTAYESKRGPMLLEVNSRLSHVTVDPLVGEGGMEHGYRTTDSTRDGRGRP